MKKIEKNNLFIALIVLYTEKEKYILPMFQKNNLKREKQAILFMIPNGEGWHDLAVKKISKSLKGITSKHVDDFYC